jgi:NAD(P)-dependent dehydrogenase (short-subunit alcohol dehydrogenase family)
MARELGPLGIRVNVVRPGPITTDIHEVHGGLERIRKIGSEGPLGRAGKPVEVAAAALWLVSPAASYVTGCILEVTGGL